MIRRWLTDDERKLPRKERRALRRARKLAEWPGVGKSPEQIEIEERLLGWLGAGAVVLLGVLLDMAEEYLEAQG